MLLCAGPVTPLAAQGLFYEGGLSVASGDYIFSERTTTFSLGTGLAIDVGRITLRASLPIYFQNTTLVSPSGPQGGIPTGGSSSGAVRDSGEARRRRSAESRSGDGQVASIAAASVHGPVEVPASAVTGYEAAVGDPTGQISWRAVDGYDTRLTVSLVAKAPIADTATFGTGMWDVGSSLTLNKRLWGRASMMLDVSYWHLGDLSTLDFQDPLYGTTTLAYIGDGGWGGGLSFSAGTSALRGYDGPVWIGGYAGRTSQHNSWSVSGSVGLTETTPDLTLGFFCRVALLSRN